MILQDIYWNTLFSVRFARFSRRAALIRARIQYIHSTGSTADIGQPPEIVIIILHHHRPSSSTANLTFPITVVTHPTRKFPRRRSEEILPPGFPMHVSCPRAHLPKTDSISSLPHLPILRFPFALLPFPFFPVLSWRWRRCLSVPVTKTSDQVPSTKLPLASYTDTYTSTYIDRY